MKALSIIVGAFCLLAINMENAGSDVDCDNGMMSR